MSEYCKECGQVINDDGCVNDNPGLDIIDLDLVAQLAMAKPGTLVEFTRYSSLDEQAKS